MPDPTPEEMVAAKFAGTILETTPEDDPGTVDASEEAAQTEPIEAEQSGLEPPPEPGEPRLYAGRYKTVEELERAYQVEAQDVITRQGQELGELRALKEQFEGLREDLSRPAAPAYDPSGIEDELALQPHLIPQYAQQALDAGDSVLYSKAISAWHQLDPGGATAFQVDAHMRAAQAQIDARLAPIQQSTQRAEAAQQLASAFEAKAAEHPDFTQIMNGITQEQLAGFPKAVVAQLETGDQATKLEVLETLYRWNKAEQAGNLTQAVADAAAATAADAAQARQEAVVATTTSTTDRTPVVKTPIEQFHEQFQNSSAFRKAAGLA